MKKRKTPSQMAWELFEKTGKAGYYRLYKKLTTGSVDEDDI